MLHDLFAMRINSLECEEALCMYMLSFRQASRVLCATLAIPLPAARNQTDLLLDLDESGIEKQKRLAGLLSLPNLPTRQTLVRDLVGFIASLNFTCKLYCRFVVLLP